MFKLIFIIRFTCSIITVLALSGCEQSTPTAFKHQQVNYSVDTSGGDNGEIVKVVNLNSDGIGSLRWAIEQSGARKIIFEVGGVIDLNKSSLKIEMPFVSILGKTAPSPGITLIKGGIRIKTHHVKISHLMIRPGDAGEQKK